MYSALETAKDWGLLPSQFFAAAEDDRACMIAYSRTSAKMRAWEAQEQERKMERAKRRSR